MNAARSQARTRVVREQATLSSLDFLSWAKHEFARRPALKIRLQGTSMAPAIRDAEIVLVERADPSVVRRGDIVLYCSSSETAVIHKVAGFTQNSYGRLIIARGDNCTLDDVPFPEDRVLGRVIAVERDGSLIPLLSPRTRWSERARGFFLSFLRVVSRV